MKINQDYGLYDKTADSYDSERFSGLSGRWGHLRQMAALEDIGGWEGKRILEIGCGTGRITEQLVKWGSKVTATDISPKMLAVAKVRIESIKKDESVEFKERSLFDKGLDLTGFDRVVMVNVLGRISKAHEAISTISLKMPHECDFIFSFPNLYSILMPFGLMVNVRNKSLARDVTSHWFKPETIKRFCRETGLEIRSWHGNHYVPLPRFLFYSLPFFMLCESAIASNCPRLCPSVFVNASKKI